ncbi:MAG: SDR family NAD(P)-dependent oxidoreductase [Myxococcales bacterium]|nr:SDR family NAD(P)-dependent oxidoreductase [Myxococcales bacterium]
MAKQSPSEKQAILITGCSSGIGKATALRLAAGAERHGWVVYATARRPETLHELARAGCRTLALDVTDSDSMATAVATIEARHGGVGVLVNNAGYCQAGAIEAVPMDRVNRQFATNVFGPIELIQRVLPGMRRRGAGRIINLSSMGGRLTFPGGGFYHATKYAIEALSDALRFEVRGFGIAVVLIEPGLIKSGFSEAASSAMITEGDRAYDGFHDAIAKATHDLYEKGMLAKLAGTPDDVARAIERAVLARRPKARYPVSPSARLLLTQRALMSDRLWDAMMRTSFPSPSHELAAGV